MYKYKTRPKGLKYTIKTVNKGWINKGDTPWNKGIPCSEEVKEAISKSNKGKRYSKATEFTSKRTKGDKNCNWKGDEVGYYALHTWVNRTLGKPSKCQHCKIETGKVEWANKSGDYKRDIKDWIPLCKKCHCKHDKDTWGNATKLWKLNKK